MQQRNPAELIPVIETIEQNRPEESNSQSPHDDEDVFILHFFDRETVSVRPSDTDEIVFLQSEDGFGHAPRLTDTEF